LKNLNLPALGFNYHDFAVACGISKYLAFVIHGFHITKPSLLGPVILTAYSEHINRYK